MGPTPLIITYTEREAIRKLRDLASRRPLDVRGLAERLKIPETKAAHMKQMTEQTIEIPLGFLLTYSLETGHPGGTARHMSLSSPAKGRIPSPEAVWMICEELGFIDGLEACYTWIEELARGEGRENAVNVVQIVSAEPSKNFN